MSNAYLNCVKKEITFALEDQKFTIDLTEGDLEDSWNSITCRGKLYDVNFSWEEGFDPNFTLYPVIIKSEEEMLTDWDNDIIYNVIIDTGGFRDYFSIPFPNGISSWAHTYGVMCTLTHDKSGSNGRIAFLETLSEWAFEFEEENQYTNWEETQWDETLDSFLTDKLINNK